MYCVHCTTVYLFVVVVLLSLCVSVLLSLSFSLCCLSFCLSVCLFLCMCMLFSLYVCVVCPSLYVSFLLCLSLPALLCLWWCPPWHTLPCPRPMLYPYHVCMYTCMYVYNVIVCLVNYSLFFSFSSSLCPCLSLSIYVSLLALPVLVPSLPVPVSLG